MEIMSDSKASCEPQSRADLQQVRPQPLLQATVPWWARGPGCLQQGPSTRVRAGATPARAGALQAGPKTFLNDTFCA